MAENTPMNHQIVLNSRPQGAPKVNDFREKTSPLPTLAPGQVLLHTLYLSLDPYMRGRMSDSASYAAPVGIGEVMVGAVVARVKASQHPGYKTGDLVLGTTGEGPSLSYKLRCEVVERVCQQVEGRESAGAPAVVAVVERVGRPDELQIDALVVAVTVVERIGGLWLDGVAERAGLIFEDGEQEARVEAEVGRDVIHDARAAAPFAAGVFAVVL